MGPSDLADLRQEPLPVGRQVQRVQAAVTGMAAPFDVAALFQVVDEGDDPARQQ
jgi:hypothetical protein